MWMEFLNAGPEAYSWRRIHWAIGGRLVVLGTTPAVSPFACSHCASPQRLPGVDFPFVTQRPGSALPELAQSPLPAYVAH